MKIFSRQSSFCSWLTISILSLSVFGLIPEGKAAETAILKYGIFSESISVSELSNFAATGELSRSLKAHLKTANKNPEQLRQVLTAQVSVEAVLLSQILNTFLGEILLDRVSEIIHTPSHRASREALRSSLITSALPDNNILLIEVLENYPTSEVHLEGDRLVEAYQLIDQVLGKIPQLPWPVD